MMRLVFDAKNFYSRTGIPNYIIGFLEALHRERPEIELVGLSQREYSLGTLDSIATRRIEPEEKLRKIPPNLWLKFCAGRLVEKDECFFAGSTLRPIGVKGARTCVIVHDLNHLLVPETMTLGNRMAMRAFFRRDVETSAFRICNSEGTRVRLRAMVGIDAQEVVHPRANRLEPLSEEQINTILAELGLGKFLLFVGTLEPRKNLRLLLDVFTELKSENPDLELVVVGGKGWGKEIFPDSAGIRQLGFVGSGTLHALYRRCACFVLPSTYEGFGMPVLEARMHGARVVCTDLPELREAGDGDAYYVEASHTALLEGIRHALAHSTQRNSYKYLEPELPRTFLRWLDSL